MAPKKERLPEDDLIDWWTLSYRKIYTGVGIVVLLAIGGGAYYYVKSLPPPTPPPLTPPPTVTAVRFTTIEGNVKVKTVGTFEWVSADKNMTLRKGDLVRTGSGSAAEITFFADGTVVHVRPDSLITIEETAEDPSTKQRKVAWHISSGEVNFQTIRRTVPGTTEITTPTVQTRVGESSTGSFRVAQAGDSDIRLFQGTSEVQTKSGETVQLASAEGVRVDAGGRPGPKLTLPGIPIIVAPAHQSEVAYAEPSKETTRLTWKPVNGATRYRVMLDYSAYFNRPLLDRKTAERYVQLTGLDVGKYYWRVAAVSGEDVEGGFSDFARFTVNKPSGGPSAEGPPPPLKIESLDTRTNILQVKGSTEPGARVTVNGHSVDVAADGSFNEFITLEKFGLQEVVIRATGINGGITEMKRPVTVTY